MIEFGEQRAGVGGVDVMRIRIGDAGREVVRFVDQEQRTRGIEAGLIVKQRAVGGREDVVVIADPDVVESEGGAGDFVGTDARGLAGRAERGKIAGLVFEEVKTRETARGPTGFEVGQICARIAVAVKGVIDAVFGFIAHVPDGDGRGRRWVREGGDRSCRRGGRDHGRHRG